MILTDLDHRFSIDNFASDTTDVCITIIGKIYFSTADVPPAVAVLCHAVEIEVYFTVFNSPPAI